MATLQPVNVPVQSVMRNITLHVNVTGVQTWRVRMWLGLQFIKLAAFTMGCGIEVTQKGSDAR